MSWQDIKNLWPEARHQEVPMQFGFGRVRRVVRWPLSARNMPLCDLLPAAESNCQTGFAPLPEQHGQFIEGASGEGLQRGVCIVGKWVVYVPYLYDRYYVDLRRSASEHGRQSPAWKSQQVERKRRRLQAALEGELSFVCYERADQIDDFFRATSALAEGQRGQAFATLPNDATYRQDSRDAAAQGRLVCYAMCHRDAAVSYLYCPIAAGSIVYQFLGYNRRFARFSPGLVLLWSVIEHEVARGRHLYLDFTKGSGQQKRIFATGKVTCADVFVLRKNFSSLALVVGHNLLGRLSYAIELHVQHPRPRTLAATEGGR